MTSIAAGVTEEITSRLASVSALVTDLECGGVGTAVLGGRLASGQPDTTGPVGERLAMGSRKVHTS